MSDTYTDRNPEKSPPFHKPPNADEYLKQQEHKAQTDRTMLDILDDHARDVLNELRRLRKENEIMRARLTMFDDVMQLVRVRTPDMTMMYQPDAAERFEKILSDVLKRQHQRAPGKHVDPDSLI